MMKQFKHLVPGFQSQLALSLLDHEAAGHDLSEGHPCGIRVACWVRQKLRWSLLSGAATSKLACFSGISRWRREYSAELPQIAINTLRVLLTGRYIIIGLQHILNYIVDAVISYA